MIEISTPLTRFSQCIKNRRRAAWIILYALGLIIFLETTSALILYNIISPEKLRRFDVIFLKGSGEYEAIPHPYLRVVGPQYLREQNRYLSHIGENNRTNTIYIAALGGSTTESGYPAYTERYLNL